MRPLFRRYPALAENLPHADLGTFPTPVTRAELGGARVAVKRDDRSAEPYGGNKVRKLEFLLGDALAQGAVETLTFGAAGSNHALATAIYARKLGLRPISMLVHQPNARYVGRNLLAQHAVGAEVHVLDDYTQRERAAVRLLQARERETGRRPYVVPMGGTSPLGTLGFVNAAFELAGQVEAGEAPLPDLLYVPLGSMGTAAGLILGLAALAWPTRVVAVRVTPREVAGEPQLTDLLARTASLLREAGADVPDPDPAVYEVRHDEFGEEYARFTAEGMAAVRAAAEAGLLLEGTYTGKTLAALLADAESGRLADAHGLFWDTYDSHDVVAMGAGAGPAGLPEGCRRYFDEPYQELDAG